MLRQDAQQLTGAPHSRGGGRAGHRWGTTEGKIGFHGGKVTVHRPRVRSFDGHEVALPSWTAAQAEDWLGRWAMNLMLINVSTRNRARAGEGAHGTRLRAGKHAPVLLHTNPPELYRNKIGRLAEALSAPETVAEAAEVMRGLIDRIVLTPAAGELRAELHGDLAVLARFAQEGERRSAGDTARLSVVAGAETTESFQFASRFKSKASSTRSATSPRWWQGSSNGKLTQPPRDRPLTAKTGVRVP